MPSGAASTSWRNGKSPSIGSVGIESHYEHGAGLAILDPDLAAVRLDRNLTEGEAEAAIRTRRIRRLEALEYLVASFGGHAGALVRDPDLVPTVARIDDDLDRASVGRVADRILDEICEHAM